MPDASNAVKHLRERLAGAGEDSLGKALSELLDNPLLTGAIGRAFDAREKAAQAQEVAMGALNLPSAADIERLTRRLRAVSQRLEGIEDGVHRLDRALASHGVESRLSMIEEQLGTLAKKLSQAAAQSSSKPETAATAAATAAPGAPGATSTAKASPAKPSKAKPKPKTKPKPKAKPKAKPESKAKLEPKAKTSGKAKPKAKPQANG